jgi:hypothetical protein
LRDAGKEGIFTTMYLMVGRKPLKWMWRTRYTVLSSWFAAFWQWYSSNNANNNNLLLLIYTY